MAVFITKSHLALSPHNKPRCHEFAKVTNKEIKLKPVSWVHTEIENTRRYFKYIKLIKKIYYNH